MNSLFRRILVLPPGALPTRLRPRMLSSTPESLSARGKGDAYAPPTVDPTEVGGRKPADKAGKDEAPHFLATSSPQRPPASKGDSFTAPSPAAFDATKYKNEPKETDNDYMSVGNADKSSRKSVATTQTPSPAIVQKELKKAANKEFLNEPKETDNDYLPGGGMERPGSNTTEAYKPPEINPQAVYRAEEQNQQISSPWREDTQSNDTKWNRTSPAERETDRDAMRRWAENSPAWGANRSDSDKYASSSTNSTSEWESNNKQPGKQGSKEESIFKKGWAKTQETLGFGKKAKDSYKDAEEKRAVHDAFSEGTGGATLRPNMDAIPPSSNLAAERKAAVQADGRVQRPSGESNSRSSEQTSKNNFGLDSARSGKGKGSWNGKCAEPGSALGKDWGTDMASDIVNEAEEWAAKDAKDWGQGNASKADGKGKGSAAKVNGKDKAGSDDWKQKSSEIQFDDSKDWNKDRPADKDWNKDRPAGKDWNKDRPAGKDGSSSLSGDGKMDEWSSKSGASGKSDYNARSDWGTREGKPIEFGSDPSGKSNMPGNKDNMGSNAGWNKGNGTEFSGGSEWKGKDEKSKSDWSGGSEWKGKDEKSWSSDSGSEWKGKADKGKEWTGANGKEWSGKPVEFDADSKSKSVEFDAASKSKSFESGSKGFDRGNAFPEVPVNL